MNSFSAGSVDREDLGLPRNWDRVAGWLKNNGKFVKPAEKEFKCQKMKCPEIPELKSYKTQPDAAFWKAFPKKPFPSKIIERVNVLALKGLIQNLSKELTPSQILRANKVVENLTYGAPSCQKTILPAITVTNAKINYEYGREVTDTIGYWVKENFASGPFDYPPTSKLRVNCLKAIPQDGKVRPILNVSLPIGESFNDNVNLNSLEKVWMTSAREFGYTLKDCGKNSNMSKSDIKDAYKNVPAPLKDLRLQGFSWLGKFFIENSQIFGAKTAVCNFDQLGNTMVALAVAKSKVNPRFVHRHLDDVPVVSPPFSKDCENFTKVYKEICEKVNLGTAVDDPNCEKAFSNVKHGKVLGIWFNSDELTWSLPEDKKATVLSRIHDAKETKFLTILEMQKLMGYLNYVALMSPFLNGFKKNLNDCLGYSLRNNIELVRLCDNAKRDLNIWSSFILDMEEEHSIPARPTAPPLWHKTFVSDAAGKQSTEKCDSRPGVATLGLNENGEYFFGKKIVWNLNMINLERDKDDKLFGQKTTFLEFAGILTPFLAIPGKLCKQHVVCKVDNMACVYGWEDRGVKNCVYTSIMIRALHMIASYLSTVVHVQHLHRVSTPESRLVDRLSRSDTMTKRDNKFMEDLDKETIPEFFISWLDSPTEDWDMTFLLLDFVINKTL